MENNLNVVGIIRALDDLGRIVIPKEIRRVIGVHEGDSLDIVALTDGSILLRKVVDNKPVCGCPCAETPKAVETRVIHFVDTCTDTTRVVKITDEQDRFLDWLCDQDFINCNVEIENGYPEVVDLT